MKILIIDDHAVVRTGVRKLLAEQFGGEILETGTGDEGIALYEKLRPDVVILDLNLNGPGGLEIMTRLLAIDPKAKILIFTTHAEPVYAARAMKEGARGYVSKSAPADELITAVKRLVAGRQYIDQELSSRLAICQFSPGDPLQSLSTRELEILRKLGDGCSLSEIAESLGVAYKTVANTCTQIKQKLGLEKTSDLIRFSVENLHR